MNRTNNLTESYELENLNDYDMKDYLMDGSLKSTNSRPANLVIMRRTYCTLNVCGMQHNAEVGLFKEPSKFDFQFRIK